METHKIMCWMAIVSVFKEVKLILIHKTMSNLEQIMSDNVFNLSELHNLFYDRKISLHIPKATGWENLILKCKSKQSNLFSQGHPSK